MEETTPSPSIELLPEHLIDQIKAGEVVERPAALVKEILENSIDAGAKNINIHIIDNGMELISIQDDGKGMTIDELPLAFARHATSKIKRFEDIYSLESFGFRGEALASISAICRLTCSSTPINNQDRGGKIEIHAGVQKSLTPWKSDNSGTTINIKDLFYNTPARLKFVKSKQSEKNALKRIIFSFILANPTITFGLKWDDQEKEFYPGLRDKSLEDFKQRVQKVFFGKRIKSVDSTLFSFEVNYDGHRVKGIISGNSSRGNAGKSHFLFVNKRLFMDKALHQIILNSASPLWEAGETGHYFLMIDAPADQVDVNIHPNKTHIKFLKAGTIYSMTSNTIKKLINDNRPVCLDNKSEDAKDEKSTKQNYSPSTQFESSDSHNLYIEKKQSTEQASTQVKLPTPFYLHHNQKNQKTYFIQLDKLYAHFWKNILKNTPIAEEEVSPLLISEPVKQPDGLDREQLRKVIKVLSEIGLNLDILNSEQLVLRSVPAAIQHLSISRFVLPVIQIILEHRVESLKQLSSLFEDHILFEKIFDHRYETLPQDVDVLIRSLNFNFDSPIFRELNSNLLEKIFRS